MALERPGEFAFFGDGYWGLIMDSRSESDVNDEEIYVFKFRPCKELERDFKEEFIEHEKDVQDATWTKKLKRKYCIYNPESHSWTILCNMKGKETALFEKFSKAWMLRYESKEGECRLLRADNLRLRLELKKATTQPGTYRSDMLNELKEMGKIIVPPVESKKTEDDFS